MAVPLIDLFLAIQAVSSGGFVQDTGIGAQTQGAADVFYSILIRKKSNDRMRRLGIQLNAVGVLQPSHIPGVFHNGKLHAETQSKERNFVNPGIMDGCDLAVDSPIAETAGHQNAVHIPQQLIGVFLIQLL